MDYQPTKALLDFLIPMITEDKLEKFDQVLHERTRHLTVVLEDIFQPHNASAVLRSCECYGVQDVHIIENSNEFSVIRDIVIGSAKWLSLKRYNEQKNNTVSCLSELKNKGYRIVGTTPHEKEIVPDDLDLSQKTALVMGKEKEGLSQAAMDLCDDFVKVPMVGFTESLNISVCTAILVQNLTKRLKLEGHSWQLNDAEKLEIMIEWCFAVTGKKEILLDYFENQNDKS